VVCARRSAATLSAAELQALYGATSSELGELAPEDERELAPRPAALTNKGGGKVK
jgi:hypothetical protein